MKSLLQHAQCLGKPVPQRIEDRLIGGCVVQIATGGMNGTHASCGAQHDAQDRHGGAFPAVILEFQTFVQPTCRYIHKSTRSFPCMFDPAYQLPEIVVKGGGRTTGNCGFGDVYQGQVQPTQSPLLHLLTGNMMTRP